MSYAPFHWTINGVAACRAQETIGLPTVCAHMTRESVEKDVARVLEKHPGAVIDIFQGICPAGYERLVIENPDEWEVDAE